jgi:hypothetical protein
MPLISVAAVVECPFGAPWSETRREAAPSESSPDVAVETTIVPMRFRSRPYLLSN